MQHLWTNHLFDEDAWDQQRNWPSEPHFCCCISNKCILLNSLKTSYGGHLFPFQGFPLVPASIHAVARKKYFDDKWVMFQKALKINGRCLYVLINVRQGVGSSIHAHVFVCVWACVLWAADSTDWYVFLSVAVGWVWKPICSTQSMVPLWQRFLWVC